MALAVAKKTSYTLCNFLGQTYNFMHRPYSLCRPKLELAQQNTRSLLASLFPRSPASPSRVTTRHLHVSHPRPASPQLHSARARPQFATLASSDGRRASDTAATSGKGAGRARSRAAPRLAHTCMACTPQGPSAQAWRR